MLEKLHSYPVIQANSFRESVQEFVLGILEIHQLPLKHGILHIIFL